MLSLSAGQMYSKTVTPAMPKARGYFGIDAMAYGHMGHVDPSALKVPSPCPACCPDALRCFFCVEHCWR